MADTIRNLERDIPELGADEEYVILSEEDAVELAADDDFTVDQFDIETEGEYEPIELAASELVHTLSAEVIPPERVRFTAPVELRVEGDEEWVHGAILNLSCNGVAATLPVELTAGQRVWARFRLGLAEEPLSLLCVVIWRREVGPHDPLYGLQFGTLAGDERERIARAVAERAEGRAGEWPLPLLPASTPHKASSSANPWMSAAAGMVAGIVLALGLSVIPNFGAARSTPPEMVAVATEEQKAVVVEEAVVVTREPRTVLGPVEGGGAPPTTTSTATSAAAAAATATATSTAAAAATAAATSAAAATATDTDTDTDTDTAPPSPEPSSLLPKRSTPSQTITADTLRPIGTPSGVEMGLVTDGSISDFTGFWLDNPRRYVVDVPGRKSGFAATSYAVEHPLVSRVRTGQHGDKVRFVLDVDSSVSEEVRARVNGETLVLELVRK